jgi:4-alpha-glucanotransferase
VRPSNGTWLKARSSGVLAHISSLPGAFGIGNAGAPARAFIDFLAEAGFQHWQICPIGPTGFGDSPYQSFSSFAGNAYFIDLEELCQENLLHPEELTPLRDLPHAVVDYGRLYTEFWPILETAHQRFEASGSDSYKGASFAEFCDRNAWWLDGYATFMALKAHHDGRPWTEWEPACRDFDALDSGKLPPAVRELARSHRFYQFIFFHQWSQLHQYAASKGIRIIGDLPIFVSMDSADTWQHRKVFRLDASGHPVAVAGVPPDYFSEEGQFWGNPLYDWDYLKSTGYDWWLSRLAFALECCDILRLDHFRAFDTYWEIPAWTTDTRKGTMRDGPGIEFFNTIKGNLPELPIIAEDLGYITEGVVRLRKEAGFPGMKILQFGYGHDDNNVNLPHFYPRESVVYTGTHDNDTTRGWLNCLEGPQGERIRKYFHLKAGDHSAWPMIEAGFASVSRLAVFPVQDLLDLGSEARFNLPGTTGNNWVWRFTEAQMATLREGALSELQRLHELYDRRGDNRQREYSAPPVEVDAKQH